MQGAKLISYTSSCPSLGSSVYTLEDIVAYVARVSNPTSQTNMLNNSKLIQYLINHKHWSPFEMVDLTLELTTTRDIGRQILRHRSFSFQEFSQRYAATEGPLDTREARLQDHKNRQNSITSDDENLNVWWDQAQRDIIDLTFDTYDKALYKGVAKEVARAILPEGLTRTKMYMKGSLRSWIHFLELRTHKDTQKETRELANMCANEISLVFPLITEFVQKDDI